MEKATFAGGCFWCIQGVFEELKGVSAVVAGYAGGTGAKPTYEDYAAKGYVEAVEVTFDPSQIAYYEVAGCVLAADRPDGPRRAICRPRPAVSDGHLLPRR